MEKKYICLGIVLVFLVFSGALGFFFSSNHSDSDVTTVSNFMVEGEVVSYDSNIILADYSEGTEDTFVADSEDSSYYYGHWNKGEEPEAQYDINLNVNLSDVKWNTSVFNEKVIREYIEHNITSAKDDVWYINVDFGDGIESGNENFSYVTFDGDILKFSFNTTSEEFLDGDYNRTGTITICNQNYTSSIEITVTIPSESIESFNPISNDGYYHYNIEKTY